MGRKPIAPRAKLAIHILRMAGRIKSEVQTKPLPDLVRELGQTAPRFTSDVPPPALADAVRKVLNRGRKPATCLVQALVLFQLLRENGQDASVVIGLPEHALGHEAHAWVELNGRDLGPLPGVKTHEELVRWPS